MVQARGYESGQRAGAFGRRRIGAADQGLPDVLGARLPLPDLRAACDQVLTGTAVANTVRDSTPVEPCPPPPRAPLPRPRHQHPVQDTLFDCPDHSSTQADRRRSGQHC